MPQNLNLTNNYLIPNWPAPKNIVAISTTRNGGVSLSPFNTFNLCSYCGDNQFNVQHNRKLLAQELQLPSEPIWLKQEHSNIVIELNAASKYNQPSADAAFTSCANIVCVVQTADCAAILLCDRAGSTVAAIHAGWQGLANNIIETTIKTMGIAGDNLLAWIGPAIGPAQFAVANDVYELFLAKNSENQAAFIPHRDRWLANIFYLTINQLQIAGVNAIYCDQICTYSNPELFFSYRRDGKLTGRMASLIWKK